MLPAGLLWYVIVPSSFVSSSISSISNVTPYSSQNFLTSSIVHSSFIKSGYSFSILGKYNIIVSPDSRDDPPLTDWSIIKSSLPLYFDLSSTDL